MNSISAPQSPGKHVVTSRQVSLLWKDFLMNLKLRSPSHHNFGSTNCHRGENQHREPRGGVLSDFTAIIQMQLLQQPQQQQQQQQQEGQRTDNIQPSSKAVIWMMCVCVCVLVNSRRIIRQRKMEENET